MSEKTIILLGPSLGAVSGVSTHLNQLFGSALAKEYKLVHFQVGSEGRAESAAQKLWRFVWSPLQFGVAAWRARADLVHLNTSLEPKAFWRDLAYLLVAKLLGKKVLYQVHGGALPQKFFEHHPLRTALLRRVLLSSDLVVLLAQEELRAYQQFDARLALCVIPNAIDIVRDPVHKTGSAGQPLKLAYVGRLAEEKGLFDLLAALALVRDAGADVQLVLAGSGPAEPALRAQIAALGLQDRVSMVGAVFGAAKDQVWEQADLFGFPTLHREGLPYALLEAMAARTPPLICSVGAIPDVMQHGVHGFFVPPRDPRALADLILRLNDDRALLLSMRQAGRQRIEDYYSLTRLAADFRAAYATLAK